jgi:hypothetical protein
MNDNLHFFYIIVLIIVIIYFNNRISNLENNNIEKFANTCNDDVTLSKSLTVSNGINTNGIYTKTLVANDTTGNAFQVGSTQPSDGKTNIWLFNTYPAGDKLSIRRFIGSTTEPWTNSLFSLDISGNLYIKGTLHQNTNDVPYN